MNDNSGRQFRARHFKHTCEDASPGAGRSGSHTTASTAAPGPQGSEATTGTVPLISCWGLQVRLVCRPRDCFRRMPHPSILALCRQAERAQGQVDGNLTKELAPPPPLPPHPPPPASDF